MKSKSFNRYKKNYRLKRSINDGPWHEYTTTEHFYKEFKANNYRIGNVRFKEYPYNLYFLYRINWFFQSVVDRFFKNPTKTELVILMIVAISSLITAIVTVLTCNK